MRQLLARLLNLWHPLPVSTSTHGPTPHQDQPPHRSLHSPIPRSFRKAPPSPDRFRRQQPQHDAANGRRPIKLPKFKAIQSTARLPTKARRTTRKGLTSNGLIILLGILNLITLHFVLSIPVPPPLPQTHDFSAPQA